MYSFQIIQVDVGQGDCNVLIIRNGDYGTMQDPIEMTVIIDCGGGKNGVNDTGDRSSSTSLLRVLANLGVTEINMVVISHYDRDHLGGIKRLLDDAQKNNTLGGQLRQMLQNTRFYDRGEQGTYSRGELGNQTDTYIHYIQSLNKLRTNFGLNVRRMTELIYPGSAHNISFNLSDTEFTTIPNAGHHAQNFQFYPAHHLLGADLFEGAFATISLTCITLNQFRVDDNGQANPQGLNHLHRPSENSLSLTLLFRFENYTHWFSGEMFYVDENACIEPIRAMSPTNQLSSMKLGHHGSNNSTHESLIEKLHPRVVTISCGPNNTHNHPATGTLDILFSRSVKILLTGWGGDPEYLSEVGYYYPYSSQNALQIAGSVPDNVPGDLGLFSNQANAQQNPPIFISEIFAQNYIYRWYSPFGTRNPYHTDPIGGEVFLDNQGDLQVGFQVDHQTGSISFVDDHLDVYEFGPGGDRYFYHDDNPIINLVDGAFYYVAENGLFFRLDDFFTPEVGADYLIYHELNLRIDLLEGDDFRYILPGGILRVPRAQFLREGGWTFEQYQ